MERRSQYCGGNFGRGIIINSRKVTIYTRTAAGYLLALFAVSGVAHANGNPDPLFANDDIIEVRIEAPFSAIMQDRQSEEYTPGIFQHTDATGKTVRFDIGLRARGNFRRRVDICDFTPLRLNFKKSQTDGTLFDHQNKLKLVTHCKSNSPRYEQLVLNEYLAYRVLNILTDISFQVRLLRVTYVDTARNNSERVNLAFLVEHRDRLAKRIDSAIVKTRMVTLPMLDSDYTVLTSIFHYFIGNTDFSPVASAPGEDCCHNHALFAREDEKYYSIPYDFDMAGFVNAPHARPNPRFHLRSIRERLFRGRCLNNEGVPESVERFFDRREEIYALINAQQLVTKATRKSMLQFVDGFYKSLDSPKKITKNLTKHCF